MEQIAWKNFDYWLIHGLLTLLSHQTRDHVPGVAPRTVGVAIPHHHQSGKWLTGPCDRGNPSTEVPFSSNGSSQCQVGKNLTSTRRNVIHEGVEFNSSPFKIIVHLYYVKARELN